MKKLGAKIYTHATYLGADPKMEAPEGAGVPNPPADAVPNEPAAEGAARLAIEGIWAAEPNVFPLVDDVEEEDEEEEDALTANVGRKLIGWNKRVKSSTARCVIADRDSSAEEALTIGSFFFQPKQLARYYSYSRILRVQLVAMDAWLTPH